MYQAAGTVYGVQLRKLSPEPVRQHAHLMFEPVLYHGATLLYGPRDRPWQSDAPDAGGDLAQVLAGTDGVATLFYELPDQGRAERAAAAGYGPLHGRNLRFTVSPVVDLSPVPHAEDRYD